MFMRFVNLKVKEGRMNDFARFYEERTIPALQATKGCLYASLLRPRGDDVECVSITMWRSREDVDAYEKSGLYDELLDEMDDKGSPFDVMRYIHNGVVNNPPDIRISEVVSGG